jgi:hypothetical protein
MAENITIIELKVHAKPGITIGECLREGKALAVSRWENVSMEHNGQIYLIRPNDLLASIPAPKKSSGGGMAF